MSIPDLEARIDRLRDARREAADQLRSIEASLAEAMLALSQIKSARRKPVGGRAAAPWLN